MIRLVSGLIVGLSSLILIVQSINAADTQAQRQATSQVKTSEDSSSTTAISESKDVPTNKEPSEKTSSVRELKQTIAEPRKSEFPAEPSGDGYSFLGFSVFAGFVHQPQSQNVLMSDRSVDIEARLAPSHVLNGFFSTKENWELYMSSDGTNYKKVDSRSTSSLAFFTQTYDRNLTYSKLGIKTTGTYYFQFKVKTPIALGLGSYHTFYSDPFTINVVKDEITAVGISIDQGSQGEMLKNDEKDFSATLNPTTSTDKITWASSDDSVASVDAKTGTVKAHKKGFTAISAIAKNRAGTTDATVAYGLTVTGGLDDVTVDEGDPAIFVIRGLQTDVTYETTWYRQKGNVQDPKKDEVLTANDEHTVNTHNMKIMNPTMALNGSQYYAGIQAFVSAEDEHGNVSNTPAGDPFFTDTATLHVNPVPPKFVAVGDFDFGSIKIKGSDRSKHYPKNQNIIIKNAGHKDWTVMGRQKTLLKDSAGTVIPMYFQNQALTSDYMHIGTNKDDHVIHGVDTDILSYKSNEGFSLSMPEKIIAGHYESEMQWQLADVPSQ